MTQIDGRPPPPRAYSVRRLAEEWDCPHKTIYNMIKRGELRYFLLGEKSGYRIPVEEVERCERERSLSRTPTETVGLGGEPDDTLSSSGMRALVSG